MDHTDDTTNKMRELNTDPTTASASEPPSPATNDPTTGDDISRSARSSFNLGITTITLHARRNLTTANRATSNANATSRTEYHARQAEAAHQRICAQKSLGLTEENAKALTKRQLEEMVRICRTREACGISQEAEIKYLEERLAEMKYFDEMLETIK